MTILNMVRIKGCLEPKHLTDTTVTSAKSYQGFMPSLWRFKGRPSPKLRCKGQVKT